MMPINKQLHQEKKNLIEYGILPLILVAHYSTYVQLSRFTQGNNT